MIKRFDFVLILSIICIAILSLLFVYSSSVDVSGETANTEFIRQLVYFILGIIVFFVIHFFHIQTIAKAAIILYVACIALLIITLLFGEVRNGAKSWLGLFGFGIQASEFMKIATILFLASVLEERKPNLDSYKQALIYAILVFIPMGLILLQPDMGTTLVFIPIMLGIFYIYGLSSYKVLFVIGIGIVSIITLIASYYFNSIDIASNEEILLLRSNNFIYYLSILVLVLILSIVGIFTGLWRSVFRGVAYLACIFVAGSGLAYLASYVLKPYQMQRLLVFVNPESDPLGSGWHILQSVAAIGAGGLFGQGYLQGTQTKLEFLPQKSTDFIFSVIGEEIGLLGTTAIIVLYTIILWRIIYIAIHSQNLFASLYCSGVVSMFFTHFMVNVGMTLGIMPVTGIPLLLVSYGGSSLLSSMIALGLVHSIHFYSINKIKSFANM